MLRLEETSFGARSSAASGCSRRRRLDLAPGAALPGETAFRLYDTYGFPLDLTQDALRAQGHAVDIEGFEAAMERQREEARKSWNGSGAHAIEPIWFELRERHGATEFLGYETERAEGKAVALVQDGQERRAGGPGQTVMLVANQTPFYGELGGQIGDTGITRRATPRSR